MKSRQVLRRGLLAFVFVLLAVPAAPAIPGAAQTGGLTTLWFGGPGSSGAATYAGAVDQPGADMLAYGAPVTVSGWLVDQTAQGWTGFDQVQVYDGAMDAGGTLLASATLGVDRPDVAAALGNPYWRGAGFSAVIPARTLQPGLDRLLIYGHTPGKGWWYTTTFVSVSVPDTASALTRPPLLTIATPRANDIISPSLASYSITGTAMDPQANLRVGTGIDQVAVYLGGSRMDKRAAFLGNATISGMDWSLTFTPGAYPWGDTILYVYARSGLTGQEGVTSRLLQIH